MVREAEKLIEAEEVKRSSQVGWNHRKGQFLRSIEVLRSYHTALSIIESATACVSAATVVLSLTGNNYPTFKFGGTYRSRRIGNRRVILLQFLRRTTKLPPNNHHQSTQSTTKLRPDDHQINTRLVPPEHHQRTTRASE